MRVIGGALRGRSIGEPGGRSIRPTADRAREAIFNVLAHAHPESLAGGRVLDVFAGAGTLGLEALSRGAQFVLFVDSSAEACALVRRNLETLGLLERAQIMRRDATRLPQNRGESFQLAFLDAPYAADSTAQALDALAGGGWLSQGAICVVETSRGARIGPSQFEPMDERAYGRSKFTFLRAKSTRKRGAQGGAT